MIKYLKSSFRKIMTFVKGPTKGLRKILADMLVEGVFLKSIT